MVINWFTLILSHLYSLKELSHQTTILLYSSDTHFLWLFSYNQFLALKTYIKKFLIKNLEIRFLLFLRLIWSWWDSSIVWWLCGSLWRLYKTCGLEILVLTILLYLLWLLVYVSITCYMLLFTLWKASF